MEPISPRKFPTKCDCGCGGLPTIFFNGHYFAFWECTAGYQKKPEKEEQDEDA